MRYPFETTMQRFGLKTRIQNKKQPREQGGPRGARGRRLASNYLPPATCDARRHNLLGK